LLIDPVELETESVFFSGVSAVKVEKAGEKFVAERCGPEEAALVAEVRFRLFS
jgi:hypothetical protein